MADEGGVSEVVVGGGVYDGGDVVFGGGSGDEREYVLGEGERERRRRKRNVWTEAMEDSRMRAETRVWINGGVRL